MKGFLTFIIAVAILAGIGSAVWWLVYDVTPQEQIEYLQETFNGEDTAASNTAESASKLGNVLKKSFEEAQDVYENGAESKYE